VPGERLGHLDQQVIAVAVVGAAADSLGAPALDPFIALVHVGPVGLGRLGDHPEDVIDLHRPVGVLRRGEHDRRATQGRAGLDDQTRPRGTLRLCDDTRQCGEVVPAEVGQRLLSDAGDHLVNALGKRGVGERVSQRRPGGADLAPEALDLLLALPQGTPGAPDLLAQLLGV
jgi:hypothetical protein